MNSSQYGTPIETFSNTQEDLRPNRIYGTQVPVANVMCRIYVEVVSVTEVWIPPAGGE